jgi:putative DeoR family transcriptional regulator (stage III sporulation protein D)
MINKQDTVEKAKAQGRFILDNKATLRQTADHFNMSKSSVHKNIHSVLQKEDYNMYLFVKLVLENNYEEGQARGGRVLSKNKKQLTDGGKDNG